MVTWVKLLVGTGKTGLLKTEGKRYQDRFRKWERKR